MLAVDYCDYRLFKDYSFLANESWSFVGLCKSVEVGEYELILVTIQVLEGGGGIWRVVSLSASHMP